MATNPELEAAIEHDPDDEDAYFVYGDWLQTQGDPRGELIVLQAAASRDPNNGVLARHVGDLLWEHREALLGDLGNRVTVAWQLGFVRHVRIEEAKDPDVAIAALRTLLEHPSGRFVRSIAFAQQRGIDPDKVVKLLLELKRPTTLSELRIGGNWDTEGEPRLREAFPRLNRSLDAEWRHILEVLAKQRAMDLKFDADKLPRLVAKPDIEADGVHPEHVLLGIKLEIDKRRQLGFMIALHRSFTTESLDRFAVALGQQFIAAGAPTNMRWGFQAIGSLGGAAAVEWIASQVGTWTHARAVQGAELLGKIQSGMAIWELYAMAEDPTLMRARRVDAEQVLRNVASGRAMDVDRLLDRSVPPVVPETEQRATRNYSTKSTTTYDPTSRVRDAAIRRLQHHMVDGRRIPHHDFLHYMVRHPVIAPLAQRVLWATYEGIDVETTFRIDAEGKALDVGGEEVDLHEASIGVLHPAELDPASRRPILKEWREVLDDENIEPLFPQTDRVVEELREADRGATLTRFKLRSMGFDHLRATFEQVLDWMPDREDNDGGPVTIGWGRYFRRDGVDVLAELDRASISGVTARRNGKAVTFGSLHPVTASEILWAIERATSRQKSAEAPDTGTIKKGARVKIFRGANQLREGVVFWLGDGNDGPRCGIRTEGGETLWAKVSDVKIDAVERDADSDADPAEVDDRAGDAAAQFIAKADARKPKPATPAPLAKGTSPGLEKGVKVRWSKGRHAGTGIVFWIGKNKFGDGMRAGVKDDETGETVWADVDDCKPV